MLAMLLPWLWGAARWALARTGIVGTGMARFWNREAAVAAIVVVGILGLIAAAGWLRSEITAGRDAKWKEQLAKSRVAGLARQRARDQAAAEAAERARADLIHELELAIVRSGELERQLASMAATATAAGQDPDPVVFPRDLVRSLK
jgi:hypothetical protein